MISGNFCLGKQVVFLAKSGVVDIAVCKRKAANNILAAFRVKIGQIIPNKQVSDQIFRYKPTYSTVIYRVYINAVGLPQKNIRHRHIKAVIFFNRVYCDRCAGQMIAEFKIGYVQLTEAGEELRHTLVVLECGSTSPHWRPHLNNPSSCQSNHLLTGC